jgi:MtN3 and saliva related transmembrane protein
MLSLETLGFLAAVLTTVCWLPQTLKTIQTRDTQSLSLVTQSVLAVGVGLWLVYGLLIGNAPLIVSNGISIVMIGTILAMKLRYG